LRASAAIIQEVLSGAGSPIDFANLPEIDTARGPDHREAQSLSRPYNRAFIELPRHAGSGTISSFIRANGSLRPERPGFAET